MSSRRCNGLFQRLVGAVALLKVFSACFRSIFVYYCHSFVKQDKAKITITVLSEIVYTFTQEIKQNEKRVIK